MGYNGHSQSKKIKGELRLLFDCLERVKQQADHYDGEHAPELEVKMLSALYGFNIERLVQYFEVFLKMRYMPARTNNWSATEVELLSMIKIDHHKQSKENNVNEFADKISAFFPSRSRAAIVMKLDLIHLN